MFRVYRSLASIGPEARPSAVAIGNFDGVHAGHRALLREVVAVANRKGWRSSILTFDPHPTKVVAPQRAPKLLTTIAERLEEVRGVGIQQAFILPFNAEFSNMAPEEFVKRVLVDGLGAAGVFVGANFRFGFKQAGDVQLLDALGRRLGFFVEVVPSVFFRNRMVSSSEVRRLLENGEVSLAGRLLEKAYSISGMVVHGQGIGSRQTVPTLNLDTAAEIIPADGVYITCTKDTDDGREWQSISNIGMRPTFDGEHRTIETFLLSPFDGNTPRNIQVRFLRRVRGERKFPSAEALKAQIMSDAGRAQAFFRRTALLPL